MVAKSLNKFIEDYKVFLKPWVLEEPFDFVFFRPAAYVLVKLTWKLNLKPDHYSLLALFSSFFSFYYLKEGTSLGFLLGGLGIIVFSILDCCDGMVARVRKNGSRYGEQVDMFVDLISNIFFFTGIFLGIQKSQGFGIYEVLIWVAAIFLLVHASLYRFFKEQYVFFLEGKPNGREEKLKKIRSELEILQRKKKAIFSRFLLRLYLGFSNSQGGKNEIKYYNSNEYIKLNRFLLPMWGLVAGSTHLLILAIALMFHRIGLYFWYSIVLGNLILILTLLIQVGVNSTIGEQA